MAFVGKHDYNWLHINDIMNIDGWCQTKQIVTK